jgi:hypothetical protein
MSKKVSINIAALTALKNGDVDNFLVAATEGGIEAQEAAGQKDFVNNSTLPIECHNCTRDQLEQMGIMYGKSVDDLFVNVVLPEGWQKEATDHSMWSYLLDDKGRRRASIFFKAAFYDRSAFISLDSRYGYGAVPANGWENQYRSEWICVVTDCDKVIWTADKRLGSEPDYGDSKAAWKEWYNSKCELGKLGRNWLDDNFPDWQNPLAYWD